MPADDPKAAESSRLKTNTHAAQPLSTPEGSETPPEQNGEPTPSDTLSYGNIPSEMNSNQETFSPEAQALLAEMGLDAEAVPDSTLVRAPHEMDKVTEFSLSPTPAHPLPDIPGYQILGELGRGGMGVVYKAQHLRLNRTVALKMVLGSGTPDTRALTRFLVEAEAMAAIRHRHVVQVYEVGERDHNPFLVLEYLAGGALSERLAKGANLKPLVAAKVIGQVARGTAAIHSASIVHRDLKPGNILFDADGLPKITDFGLAKRAASDLTETQAIMGTPAYMAPEQADGRTKFVGPAADVWSLGVILYECLVGVRPFAAPVASEILARILTSDPTPIRRVNRDLPAELELICLKCLEKDPNNRYPTAEELADDLEAYQAGRPISVRPLGFVSRAARWVRRNPAVSGLAAFAGLTLLVVPPAALLYQSRLTAAEKLADAQTHAEAEARRAETEARRAEAEARRAETEAHRTVATKDYFNILGRVQRSTVEPQPGWTWAALHDLSLAGGYADLAARDPVELRSAAAVCLSSPDLKEIATAGRGMTTAAMAFHPNGKILALAEAKAWLRSQVLLVDPMTGNTIRTLTFNGIPIVGQGAGLAQDGGRAMAFSPDGRWLILGCRSGHIFRWDLATEPPGTFSWGGHTQEISGVAFDPEGKSVYTSSADGTVKRWAVDGDGTSLASVPPTGARRATGLAVLPGESPRVLFHRNGLESASPDTLTLYPDEQIPALDGWRAATPSLNLLVTSGSTGLAVWDRRLRQRGRNFADPDLDGIAQRNYGRGGAVTHDGSLVASIAASPDGTLRLWDMANGHIALRLFLNDTRATAFSPDSRLLAVATDRKTILYEVRRGPEYATLAQAVQVQAFGVRPDGRVVTVAGTLQHDPMSKPANLFLDWPVDGKPPRTLWNHHAAMVSPTYIVAPFAGGLACSDGNGWIDVESNGSFTLPGIAIGYQKGDEYAFSTDQKGQRLWLAYGNKVTVFDIPTKKPVAFWQNALGEFTTGLAGLECIDASDRWAVVGGRDGSVRLMRYVEGGAAKGIEVCATWPGETGAISALATNPDESLVAAGTHSGRVVVRQVPDGKVVADLDAHQDRVTAIAFSADGQLLATGGRDKKVRLWRRTANGFELLVNLGSIGVSAVKQVAFSPDGRLLILRERESAVRSWHIEQLRTRLTEMGIGW